MSVINNLAKSGAWDFQTTLAPAAVAFPLLIEGTLLVKNLIQNPTYLKERVVETKSWIVDSFTPREGEQADEAILRIAKNAFITLACLTLMGATAYASIHLLPAAMGISTAISAIFLIGKLFINAETYKKNLLEAFTAKPGEDPLEAQQRIRNSILKTAAAAICLGAAMAIGIPIIAPLLQKFSWSVSLPFQTKAVVFCEYAALALFHAGIAYSKYSKGDSAEALFHTMAAIAGLAFPLFYLHNEMRLHHSFYGLAFMAIPSRTAKIFGSLVTLDSSLYMLAPQRGGMTAAGRFSSFDFINIVVNRFLLFLNGYTAAAIAENVNDGWANDTAMTNGEQKQAPLSPLLVSIDKT